MSNAVVPAIPPLSGIQDQQTRAALEAIVNGWLMRNGQTGSGENAFLTRKDLDNLIQQVVIVASNGAGGDGGGLGGNGLTTHGVNWPNGDSIRNIINAVQLYVLNSPALRLLQEQIEYIARPEWLQDRISKGFKEEIQEYSDANTAMFKHILTQGARYDQSLALIQQRNETITTATTALATSVETIQASVGDLTTSVQAGGTALATIQGQLSAQYWIKTDAYRSASGQPLITGLYVYSDNTTSQVVISAANFAVAAPGASAPEHIPFIVKTSGVGSGSVSIFGQTIYDPTYAQAPAGVYMNSAFIADATIATAKIADATITTAKIHNAAVDTLKIAGGAVTSNITSGVQNTSTRVSAGGSSGTLASAPLGAWPSDSSGVLVTATVNLAGVGGGSTVVLELRRNGAVFSSRGVSAIDAYQTTFTITDFDSPPAGNYTYTLTAYNPTSGPGSNVTFDAVFPIISVSGSKR